MSRHLCTEIHADGTAYRYSTCQSAATPYRITAMLPSNKRSTSGQKVGHSWQTWKKGTREEMDAEWERLLERAKEEVALASKPAQEAEVLPPETALVAQNSQMGNMEQAASMINAEYDNWKRHDAEANMTLLRLGILLEAVHATLSHGEFGPWMEANVTVSKSHAYRFRGVARQFMHERKLLLPEAVDLSRADGDTDEAATFEDAAREWIGERSQSDLFESCKPPREKRGGDHGGGQARKESAKQREKRKQMEAADRIPEAVMELRRVILDDKLHIYLDPDLLKQMVASVTDCVKAMRSVRS